MKSLNTFLLLAMLMMAMAIALTSATTSSEEVPVIGGGDDDENQTSDLPSADHRRELATSLQGASRFRAPRTRVNLVKTCDKYPRVCRAKGSPGPDCCKKKCVNVLTDRFSCGKCGKKCKYWEICCNGECVNPMTNKKHCGRCSNKCKKGSSCTYGMCSYA